MQEAPTDQGHHAAKVAQAAMDTAVASEASAAPETTFAQVAEEAKKGDMVVLVLEQIDAWENASWDKLVHTSANKEEMLAIQSLDSLMMLTAAEKRRLWSSRDTFLDMSLLGKFIQVRMRHESRVCTPLNCF